MRILFGLMSCLFFFLLALYYNKLSGESLDMDDIQTHLDNELFANDTTASDLIGWILS